ncbi:hypothetical protein GWO43_30245 [candidate division KSB1 bacterium]|nr:hypothetical protein [candidate division KSB1 bacterium]NIV70639.1 hypothetical protein [Phycisphaerae bacterium]NIS28172.1 hypothetical protein [candidate division KSB1 bacterium]NIT75064.1 hypothetical protein [candidate division KSB1 bacterium]NIU28850.1 hypothetical protein [candidate division KSB1 bacterium]
MTPEQIFKFRDDLRGYLVGDEERLDAVCQMALNSIPRKFDLDDQSTWPEDDGYYLCEFGKLPRVCFWQGSREQWYTKQYGKMHDPRKIKSFSGPIL